MGFKNENQDFLHQNLIVNMKGLPDYEKLLKYELVKEETRKRLKASYVITSNKVTFYRVAFSELSFYETDFLMLNLFFEKDAYFIFKFLYPDIFSDLNFQNRNGISSKFFNYNEAHRYEDADVVMEFLKAELFELIGINENTWNNRPGSKTLIQAYAEWVINSIKNVNNEQQVVFSYFLFCKLWNHVKLYLSDFNNQATLFYHNIIRNVNDSIKDRDIDLHYLVSLLSRETKDLFSKDNLYFPLLDFQDNPIYSQSYLNKRVEFDRIVNLSKLLCSSLFDKSFAYIFDLMDNNQGSIVVGKLYDDIVNKLNKFQLPDALELKDITEKQYGEEVNSLKKDFLRRLYMY